MTKEALERANIIMLSINKRKAIVETINSYPGDANTVRVSRDGNNSREILINRNVDGEIGNFKEEVKRFFMILKMNIEKEIEDLEKEMEAL